MKNLRATSLPAFFSALLALSNTGCSLLFVNERPSPRPGSLAPAAAKCTSSQVAPVLDTIFTGLEVTRVLYAASADDSVYKNPNQPLSREADVALGLGFTALFLGSSLYGFTATRNCRKYQKDNDDTSEHEWESEPADVKRGSPARVAPPTANLDAPSAAETEAETEVAPSPAAAATAPDATDATTPDTTDGEAAPTPPLAPPASGKP